MTKFEEEANSRFEPIAEFVKGLKQATNLVSRPNLEENRNFLKTIGSNLRISDQRLSLVFKNPWKIVAETSLADLTREAQHGNFSESPVWRKGRDSNLTRYFVTLQGIEHHLTLTAGITEKTKSGALDEVLLEP